MMQMLLIVASMMVTFSSSKNLRMKLGLPIINRASGWIILGTFSPPSIAQTLTPLCDQSLHRSCR